MSRSYRKNIFDSYVCYSRRSMKAWRSQENRRLRRTSKVLIDNCEDFDSLILPVLNDFDTLWGSPQDGKKHYIDAPLLNECEFRRHERMMKGFFNIVNYRFDGEHYESCECYTNRRSYYWKLTRK
jgi:hypothetical protein